MKKVNYLDFPKEYKERGNLYREAFDRVMRSGFYILGNEVRLFEEEFAKYLGMKYAIGVANGLEALQISLLALRIKEGDEVITTPISAVATTLAIMAVGSTPVFVDIKENGQLDEDLIEKAITKKTKAIIPVHLYGQPLEIEKIARISRKHKLFLIEDACQAHGTRFNGRKVGNHGILSCFSFYPTKNLGAIGDGGLVATNNKQLYESVLQIRDYGQESKYKHSRYGLNSRLDELHAAILREKLRFLEKDNVLRRKIAKRYISNLNKIKGPELILPNKIEDSNYHLFVVKTQRRDELKKFLAKHGIPSLIHYPTAIPDQPLFGKKYRLLKIPTVRSFVRKILSLPCHPFMGTREVDYVCGVIKDFFNV